MLDVIVSVILGSLALGTLLGAAIGYYSATKRGGL